MHGFRVSRETSIQGGGLSIHGSRQLFYSSLSDCAAACRAAVDCGAFVHSHGTRPYHCTFKRLGAAVEGMLPSRTKDTYRKTHKSLAKSLRMPMPTHTGATLHMHNLSHSWPSRIVEVDGLLSASEAEVLQRFAADCFKRQRAAEQGQAQSRHLAPTTETTTVGDRTCPAGAAAGLLSRVEVRISQLTGLPLHEAEEPLMLTRQRPRADAPWLDGSRVHHDRINAAKEGRHVTVLVYLSGVEDAQGGAWLWGSNSLAPPCALG